MSLSLESAFCPSFFPQWSTGPHKAHLPEMKKTSPESHDVGSNTFIPLPLWVRGDAVFSGRAQEYRTKLFRIWDETLPSILWVMMNPSLADAMVDDRTVYRCRTFSMDWGFGAMWVGNTFAYRCTNQKRLLEVDDPVGPDNNQHLLEMAADASLIIFAYGTPHRTLRTRGIEVADMFRQHGYDLHVLKLSKDGIPVHPLYLPASLRPTLWQRRTG